MSRTFSLRLGAILDLLRRYGAVFRHAWGMRRELDAPRRLAHEAQFLPAALELTETPVSPAPRVAMWLIISFALIALAWAIFGRIDVVATAHGKIVPNDRIKVIQPFETASVKAIHVADGQLVKAGQVLVELDPTTADADSARVSNDLLAARLQAARAKAMLAAIGAGTDGLAIVPRPQSSPTAADAGLAPRLGRIAGVAPDRLNQEQRLLDGQYGEYQARLARIDADLSKREAEIRSTREIVRRLEQTAPMARQRAQDLKDLADKNFVSRHGYLEKEQLRIEQEGELATQKSRLDELAAALKEGESQRRALTAETRRIALDSLNEAEQKTSTYTQEQVKTESRGRLMTLTAPVDGTVQQLAVHTVGGVVTPAQALMVVVPAENTLEVEAFLENKDIGFVNGGQTAAVKIETFPFTKYGTIGGEVLNVSTDAINDEKKGLIYAARVRLRQATMRVDARTINLSPGMAVTVEIKTGTRRVIEYFLSPLLQHVDESLRER